MASIVIFLLNKIEKKWRTKTGLIWESLLFIFIEIYLFFIQNFILLILIPFLYLVWLIIWFFLSSRIINPASDKKKVILCFNIDEDALKNYNRVFIRITKTLQDLNLDKKIILYRVAEDVITNNHLAHKFRERWNLDLIIWGNTYYGHLSGNKVIKFKIYHTFRISASLQEKLKYFLADITLILLKKNWTIQELNELKR